MIYVPQSLIFALGVCPDDIGSRAGPGGIHVIRATPSALDPLKAGVDPVPQRKVWRSGGGFEFRGGARIHPGTFVPRAVSQLLRTACGGKSEKKGVAMKLFLWTTLLVIALCTCALAQQASTIVDEDTNVIHVEKMYYPPVAQSGHTEGVVVVRGKLDEHGKVVDAEALSGSDFLVPQSVANARKWCSSQILTMPLLSSTTIASRAIAAPTQKLPNSNFIRLTLLP